MIAAAMKMTKVLNRLESRRILAVHGEDGLCELTVTAPTLVSELRDGTIREYTITAEEMGLRPGKLDDIRTDSAKESAQMILAILSGEDQGTPRDMALINTSGALVVAGLADDLKQGVSLASEAVDSGRALEKLEQLTDGASLEMQQMLEMGLIRNTKTPVKLLGRGSLTKKIKITVDKASRGAVESVTQAGGEVIIPS